MLWVVRAAERAESEQRALQQSRIYASWCRLRQDLSMLESQDELRRAVSEHDPDLTIDGVAGFTHQIWAFAHEIQPGDWIVVPTRRADAFHIGEAVGTYVYDPEAEEPYLHSRELRWSAIHVPRARLDLDLRHAFSGFMRVFRANRNDAEARLLRIARQERWALTPAQAPRDHAHSAAGDESPRDHPAAPTAKLTRRQLLLVWKEAQSADSE